MVVVGVGGDVTWVELDIVSARRRTGVGVLVNFAPDRSLGRQLDSCWRLGVVSAASWDSTGESLITRASLLVDGVTSLTAGKRLYFFACGGPGSILSSSNGRGDNGMSSISSSAPDLTSDVSTDWFRSPRSNRSIAGSTAGVASTGKAGLFNGDGSWM
jgi:hypothetical protein